MIKTCNLVKTYGQDIGLIRALDSVSLEIDEGELVSIVGPSGSGKSTLLNLIGGVELPTSGAIFVGGRDIGRLSDRELTLFRRRKVGFVFQSFNLLPNLTVEENVALPLILDGVSPRDVRKRAGAQLETIGIAPRRSHRPDQLSGGEVQRVAIARALVTDPQIVLADEPTGNLDSKNSDLIFGLLRECSRVQGMTVVIVTHDTRAAAHGNRIVTLRDGCLDSDERLLFGRGRHFENSEDVPASQTRLFQPESD